MAAGSALDDIATIERHSARAWPAPVVMPLDGWEMRFAPHSSSRRVNSLNPVAPEPGRFHRVLDAYLQECIKRDTKAHIRLLPLARENERDILKQYGIEAVGQTSVEVAALTSSHEHDRAITISSSVTDQWLDAYIGAHAYQPEEREAVRAMLETVPYPMGFACLIDKGEPVAVGRTALIDGLAGFYQIATAPAARRQGYARRVVRALMDYAALKGAGRGYLQVEMGNAPARGLYASLGFKPLYFYDYWAVPTSIIL